MKDRGIDTSSKHPAAAGNAAIDELRNLIASAIRSSDDDLVGRLDGILRNVERLAAHFEAPEFGNSSSVTLESGSHHPQPAARQ